MSDTINFTPYPGGTIITNQYLYDGAVFMGYNGSSDPEVQDYTTSYGRVLRSDNWYNAIRLNFVDSANSSQVQLVQRIEFDNPINPEVDYISIDVYDTMDVVIYHYVSTSPEHVVINLGSPSAAYITFDDSAGTAYVVDNIYFETGTATGEQHLFTNDKVLVFPNPVHNEISLTIQKQKAEQATFLITNIYGQTVFSKQEHNPNSAYTKTINLGFLSNGIYFLEVLIDGTRTVKKIVKE